MYKKLILVTQKGFLLQTLYLGGNDFEKIIQRIESFTQVNLVFWDNNCSYHHKWNFKL